MRGNTRTQSIRCDICKRRIYYRPAKGEPAKTLKAHKTRAHRGNTTD